MKQILITRPHFVVVSPSSSSSSSPSSSSISRLLLLFRRSGSSSCFLSPLSISTSSSSSSYWIVRGNPEKSLSSSNQDDNDERQVVGGGDGNSGGIISACFVGLLTGLSVVLFNNLVHEIRDLSWDGIPSRGASWLRELRYHDNTTWERIILIPTCGGLVVSLLNTFQTALDEGNLDSFLKVVLQPILKAVAAAVTLGTGNSLGPEGPSVEIGASVANGVASFFEKDDQRKLSLKAAGSAAGIASGFNAAVAGCFFAVESVLWAASSAESSLSLTNSTSTVILSAVIASVVSEIGLGSEPAFTVPDYDFRSPSELPLYLLLGIFCGVVSLSFSWCTSWMMVATDKIQNTLSIPKSVFPVVGGFTVGLIALRYPEVLYWGFDNVDTLLESRPFVKGLSVDLLVQLIGIKIVATSFCRACGLVGGYYAPSLFIGAATGMAYGKMFSIFHLSGIEVASPQAYGLVGMAATLAGVCQVPLTAVLLLFELTRDYRIVLPLLGAVGLSSWISSRSIKKKDPSGLKVAPTPQQPDKTVVSCNDVEEVSHIPYNFDENTDCMTKKLLVSEAMKTQYVTVLMNTMITQVLALMVAEKQSCAIIVDEHNLFSGLLTLQDIQNFCRLSKERNILPEELVVAEVCSLFELSHFSQTVTPMMNLYSAELIMNTHGMTQLPVILEKVPVGILDTECINIACRAFATREYLISCSEI